MRVVHERDAPHRAPRGQARVVGLQPATAMLVFEEREMRCDLSTQLRVAAILLRR